jgi:hypothetical protein
VTLPRRMAGLEFVEIPGLSTSLRAFLGGRGRVGGGPSTWDEALAEVRRGLYPAVVVEGDPGHDHLRGAASIPPESIHGLRTTEKERWSQIFHEFPGGLERFVLVGLPGTCRQAARIIAGGGSSDAGFTIRALPDPAGSLPAYPLGLALCGPWARWKVILEQARDLHFFKERPAATAALYADLLLAQAQDGEGGGPAAPRTLLSVFPQAGSVFIEALQRALSSRLTPEEMRRILPPPWLPAQPGPDGEAAAHPHHYCRSCSASLNEAENQGVSDRFCRYCSDATGNLRPRAEVREILTRWMMNWQGPMPVEEATRRADSLMSAMPAWCEN